MNILSVQSWVSYGHVGNAAALFPLQRLGAEVCAVNTVQFSNHPGYGAHTGRITGGDAVSDLVAGLAARGVLSHLDAVLSGYLGDAATLDAVLDAVAQARTTARTTARTAARTMASADAQAETTRPRPLFCCDPVLGDQAPGLYVAEGLAHALRERAVPHADILTPNLFELGFLVHGGRTPSLPRTRAELAADATRLRARMRPDGAGLVLVTSVVLADGPPDQIGVVLSTPEAAHIVHTPVLPGAFNGAGDLLSALFLWGLLSGKDPVGALEHAASAVWCVLEHTARHGGREPMIVQAQDALVSLPRRFRAEPF